MSNPLEKGSHSFGKEDGKDVVYITFYMDVELPVEMPLVEGLTEEKREIGKVLSCAPHEEHGFEVKGILWLTPVEFHYLMQQYKSEGN